MLSISYALTQPTADTDIRQPGAVTKPSRAQFISSLITGGPISPFATPNVWHSCHTITFRWQRQVQPIVATGMDVLELEEASFSIRRDYSESSLLAFLKDYGCVFAGGYCAAVPI
jgi:hypothetical protein